MHYVWGILFLIYGFAFYKAILKLRSFRANPFMLKQVEAEPELKEATDGLVQDLNLEFVAQYLEETPIISDGHPNHHLVYQAKDQALLLWFFLLETEAELRAAILKIGPEDTVTEIPQGAEAWHAVWKEQVEAQDNSESGQSWTASQVQESVTHYLRHKSRPMLEAYGQSLPDGSKRLSWAQVFRLFFQMLGKKKVGITCGEDGKLTILPRKEKAPPDTDHIGHTFRNQDLMVLLDLKWRQSQKLLRQNQKKSQWLLPASLLAFLASFSGWLDWQTIIVLALVIFIHELGHWAAMRAFSYEDTSFLFLPFFGGVAMGRKKSPRLYESTLVLLAGPVPGVLLALALALAFPTHRHPMLSQFILMLWVINLLNLLPIVPLDGGRIVTATLFSKTPRLEFVFRLLTGVTLLGFYFKTDDYIILMLGIIVLMGTASTKKIADVCHQFRLQASSERSDFDVALKTYQRFDFDPLKHFQQIRSNILDQVFQRMGTGSTGWPASLLWLFIYAACLAGTLGLGMTRVLN